MIYYNGYGDVLEIGANSTVSSPIVQRFVHLEKIVGQTTGTNPVVNLFVPVFAGISVYWGGKANGTYFSSSTVRLYSDTAKTSVLETFTFELDADSNYVYKRGCTPSYDGYLYFEGVLVSNLEETDIATYWNACWFSNYDLDNDRFDDSQTITYELPENGRQEFQRKLLPYITDLAGAIWMQIGDSLTALSSGTGSDGFGTRIAQKYRARFLNNGTFGASYMVRNNDEYDSFCGCAKIDELVASGNYPDYLTIALGTNDSTSLGTDNINLGSLESTSADKTTLYGAVRYCIEQIQENAPWVRLGIILPPQRGTSNLFTVSDAIREVAAEYAVPCCDMTYASGIVKAMLGDGLHMTATDNDTLPEDMPTARWKYMHTLENFLLSL